MNDYNRGALSEPCMRLPYGFGGDWASIELGDGTGYVKLSEYEKVASDNDKLRALVSSVLVIRHDPTYEWLDARLAEICGKGFTEQARELGVEV